MVIRQLPPLIIQKHLRQLTALTSLTINGYPSNLRKKKHPHFGVEEAFPPLAQSIRQLTSLQRLQLVQCHITGKQLLQLATALGQHQLKELVVADRGINACEQQPKVQAVVPHVAVKLMNVRVR